MKKLGVIGFGARAQGMLRNFNTFDMDATIAAVADIDLQGAKERVKLAGFDENACKFYNTLQEMMENSSLDGIVVATNCSTHTQIATQAMKYNLPMLLEKPVAIDTAQLSLLSEAAKSYKAQCLVSFPLRVSTLCTLAKKIIDSGEIGKVQHVQAINNVTYGRVYYKNWYRNEKETGGLFLQKATHDLDYINFLLPNRRPVAVCAMESKQVFTGDMPANLACDKCEKNKTCAESVYVLKNCYQNEDPCGEMCSFAVDTGNHDSASVIVRYNDGMHAVYTQNFFVRKAAAKRGARLVGFDGTLEFDWITGECNVYSHKTTQTATYKISNNELFHYGGDKVLCENFIEILNGGTSKASLQDGILSANMCLQARESAQTDRFMPIEI